MNTICIMLLWMGSLFQEPITAAIDQLDAYWSLLEGKRVGVVANQTSVNRNGTHLVDLLVQHGVCVPVIFCPEHGFRGLADAGEPVKSGMDKETGVKVVSLYGKNKKPTKAQLEEVDIVVFDLQDLGVRFYTYLSTLHYVMEACAENNIPILVLDRANPNSYFIDGPVLEEEQRSFVGMHPVPIVYGMTIGEYARMVNGEGWLKGGIRCDLIVAPLSGWHHAMGCELTVKPSPNLVSREAMLLYPSICLFEGTVINEGRGTPNPFTVFGHPALKDMPYSYTPIPITGMCKHPKCENELCHGMNLIEDVDKLVEGKRLELSWLVAAYTNFPDKKIFFMPFFDKLSGTSRLRKQIEEGVSLLAIYRSWEADLALFKTKRSRYLLYED